MCATALVIGILLAAFLLYRRRIVPQQAGRESTLVPQLRGQVNEGYWTPKWDDAFEREDEAYMWAATANVAAFERQRPWQERLFEIVGDENPQMPSDGPVLLPRLSIRQSINDQLRTLQALNLQGWERERPHPPMISPRQGIRHGSLEELYHETGRFWE
ncbi:uncharacterized protein LOC119593194 [Penaeus monodon]|uniref:uncharacterized protein LOC119593194 n=1 Tax=Penaeus monodon TaxID=6687 RepID=UPI0018A74306|nr:uncharacterized protein LOC119593194 [Penaeus monodon]